MSILLDLDYASTCGDQDEIDRLVALWNSTHEKKISSFSGWNWFQRRRHKWMRGKIEVFNPNPLWYAWRKRGTSLQLAMTGGVVTIPGAVVREVSQGRVYHNYWGSFDLYYLDDWFHLAWAEVGKASFDSADPV